MSKKAKVLIIFIIIFIPAFFILGYIKINNTVRIDWVPGTTTLQKLPEYIHLYKINFWGITLWAAIVALIPAFLSTVRTKPYE